MHFRLLSIITLLLIFPLLLFAQSKLTTRVTISGFITDSLNTENLIGANMVYNHNVVGATTNNSGFYSITVPKGKLPYLIHILVMVANNIH